jgi:hypothetical protein
MQCDEIWGYVFKKEAHKLPAEASDESIGDAYTLGDHLKTGHL